MLGFIQDDFHEKKRKESLLTPPSVIPNSTSHAVAPKMIVRAIAPKSIVPAIAPKSIVPAIAPKAIVPAIVPKVIVHAVVPELAVNAIAPTLIVAAITLESMPRLSHVVVNLETPTATPELMQKSSHAITPDSTPELVPMLPLDDKEPVKLYDAEIVTSPPPCLTMIGGVAHGSSTHVVTPESVPNCFGPFSTPESVPNCFGPFGAQAFPSLPLSSSLLHHAGRFAT
jgi:hypothetical protein